MKINGGMPYFGPDNWTACLQQACSVVMAFDFELVDGPKNLRALGPAVHVEKDPEIETKRRVYGRHSLADWLVAQNGETITCLGPICSCSASYPMDE
jgi:hypothetical protein